MPSFTNYNLQPNPTFNVNNITGYNKRILFSHYSTPDGYVTIAPNAGLFIQLNDYSKGNILNDLIKYGEDTYWTTGRHLKIKGRLFWEAQSGDAIRIRAGIVTQTFTPIAYTNGQSDTFHTTVNDFNGPIDFEITITSLNFKVTQYGLSIQINGWMRYCTDAFNASTNNHGFRYIPIYSPNWFDNPPNPFYEIGDDFSLYMDFEGSDGVIKIAYLFIEELS
jgi:hypothetical protein